MRPLSGIALLALVSALLFSGGIFLHFAPPPPAASKTAPAPAHGKKKTAAKPSAAKPALPAENTRAFPLTAAGGVGLLLSALLALAQCRAAAAPAPTARRQLAAEQEARRHQKDEFDAQSAALLSQLAEEKQRKAETEALRDQVSRQFQEFFRTLPVPCFCFAANGKIIRWNAACETLYGLPAAAALERTLWETVVPESGREAAEDQIRRVLAGESLLNTEREDAVAGGGLSRLRCSLVPLYDAEGRIIGGLSAGVDVPELAGYEQQIAALSAGRETVPAKSPVTKSAEISAKMLEEMASAAAPEAETTAAPLLSVPAELSGHPAFRARLAGEIERAARYHAPLSVIVLDLDGFGEINRVFGFEAGDEALQAAAAVLKSKLRTIDVIVPLGADEFGVILPETGDAGARVAADRLRAGLAASGTGARPPLSACFGAVLLSPDLAGAGEMAARAQEALSAARSFGAGTVVHYQDLPPGTALRREMPPVEAAPAQRRRPAKAAKVELEVG